MKYIFFLFIPLTSCLAQVEENSESVEPVTYLNEDSLAVTNFYHSNFNDSLPSISSGTVSNGSLINGQIIPFYGENFTYFDKDSYLGERAFTNNDVSEIVLNTYDELKTAYPERHFWLMELSNRNGGRIYPHRTHQNGLSADFMMPKLKDGEPYYGLDSLGKDHYFLSFDNEGKYSEDQSIQVDFNLIAHHILLLEEQARNQGYRISKVIIKVEYKDELFATEYGKKLKSSNIYVVRNLTPLINNIHDDHFHIDFEKL